MHREFNYHEEQEGGNLSASWPMVALAHLIIIFLEDGSRLIL